MSFPAPAPPRPCKIIDIMREVVLPSAPGGNIIPLTTAPLEISVGFEEVFPYGIQYHRSFEWMWPLDDWTHIKIDKSVYLLSPGDFCLIAPGMKHAEVYSSDTPVHRSLWFSYTADTARITASVFVYDSIGHGYISDSSGARVPPLFGTLLVALQNEIAGRQPHATDVCRSLLGTLAHLIVRSLETASLLPAGLDVADFTSRQVIEYLRRHYAENISLDDVAEAVHLSRNYLATVFRRETGKTIVGALTEIRLEHAKHLLVEQRRPVREVAAAVGFRSPEHFCRVFQRHENIPPSAYCK